MYFNCFRIVISLHFGVPNNQISQPNLTLFCGPWQKHFTPIWGPRQLLNKGWAKAWALQMVPLPKVRKTGAPSTHWGALPYCTLCTVHYTLNTIHISRYFPTQIFHIIFPTNFHTILDTNFWHIFSTFIFN